MRRSIGAVLCLSCLVVYGATAYPTITWWDSSNYSLAAATLGVASPPGSLLLTLLGWPVARLASPTATAHALNYLAAAIAAAAVVMVYVVASGLIESSDGVANRRSDVAPAVDTVQLAGVALGSLTFAFTTTMWDYAGRFTPYILSALFTTFILAVMLAWWRAADRPAAIRWIALLGLLFGLDFSVHRTNALLLPGAIAWILIRRFSSVKDVRSIVAGVGGLIAGLPVQFLIIPVAAVGKSPLDFNDPSNLQRFWDYVTLKRLGGGFLLQLFPRKSNIVSVQSADLLRVLGENFIGWPGAHDVLGPLPAVLAIIGLVAIWRRNRRLAVALFAVLALQIVATVMYFNIPADYFRSFDRHYLPICVLIGVLMAVGFASICGAIVSSVRSPRALVAAAVVAVAIPIVHAAGSWHEHDASNRFFAHDWAINSLQSLPPNAIYFTFGDNDTFPVMYVQSVEGFRRDVRIINQAVAHASDWVARSRRDDPSFPLSATITPDSVALHPGDQPVTYAATIASAGVPNSAPLRLDGLYWRVVADSARTMNLDLTRANILDRPSYRGLADPGVVLDDDTREMAYSYHEAAKALLVAEQDRGKTIQCRKDLARVLAALPFDRLSMSASYRESFMAVCGR